MSSLLPSHVNERRALVAEALGTFALVLAGPGAVVIDAWSGGVIGHAGVAITFGLVVLAMIQAFGETSGAHINPAVTVAFASAGRFPWARVPGYVLAQCLGAVAAAACLRFWFPADPTALGATLPKVGAAPSFGLEVVLTAILMLVILRVSSGSREQGLLAGVAIGATVGLEAMFAGPACGASMNPARSLGPALVSGDDAALGSLWLYLAAPVLGALLAIPLAALTRRPDPVS